jgi:hypothetical protein
MLYLRFFKVATLYLDGSFAHSWHSLQSSHPSGKSLALVAYNQLSWSASNIMVPCFQKLNLKNKNKLNLRLYLE